MKPAKAAVTIFFAGLLALPVYLERRSASKQENTTGTDTLDAIHQFGFYLEEVSHQSGIDFIHHSPQLDRAFEPIMPQIASVGASVSVCDYDNDGWNDLYVTNSRHGTRNALYHNLRNGLFEDVAPEMGVAELNRKGTGVSMGAVWADMDNDGFEDLFVFKWGRPQLFRNKEGTGFEDVTSGSGIPEWVNANNAIWLDYNADGLVDLFIGGYFPENIDLWNLDRTDVLTESFEYAQNGGRNYLLENRGGGKFTDVSKKAGLTSTRWTLASGAVDVDLDGYPELIVANDYGIDEFYQNRKGEGFTETGSQNQLGFSPKSGMNVTVGDTYNNGQFGIYISNISEEGVLLQGNNFWIPRKENDLLTYQNVARKNGIELGGWSYGAQFGDLNNDGFLDLYVANGFISGKKGTNYWYDYSKVTGGNRSIISDIRNWPAMNGRSHAGYQQNRIWVNTGTGFFYDVAQSMLGDQTYDSRSVVLADLWNRGVLDVIVANQNDQLLVFRNQVDERNHWIDFILKGNRSNRSAINAVVKLYWDSHTQSQAVSGGIGFSSENQRRIHFGLGPSTGVDSAEILWPGGGKQVVTAPGILKVHQIEEKK